MKKLLLMSCLMFTSCGVFKCFEAPTLPDVTTTTAETPRERLTNDLESYLIWATIAATMAAILCFALSFKMPGLSHVSYICGIVAGSCGMAIYALEWIWLIIGVSFWSLIAWGAYHLYKKSKEIKKAEGINEELAIHFDDREGQNKLNEEAKAMHLKHRHKGAKDDGTKWGVEG